MSGTRQPTRPTYRTKEEIETWQAMDSIITFRKQLLDNGVATEDQLKKIESDIKDDITQILKIAIDDEASPRPDLKKNPDAIRGFNFSNERIEKCADCKPDVLMPLEENPRVQKNKKKARYAFDEDGKAVSKIRQFNIRDALFEAIIGKFYQDSDPDRIRRGQPRLGRRVRRVRRADGIAPIPPLLQRADQRGGRSSPAPSGMH